MRYALVCAVLIVLGGCKSTADVLARNQAACEKMGLAGKDAADCAVRLYETQSGGGAIRVTK